MDPEGVAAQPGARRRCASRCGPDRRRAARRRPGAPAPNWPTPPRCRGWPPTPRRACASRTRRADRLRPPGARRSGRHSRRPSPGSRCSIAAATPPVQLGAIGLELRLVGHRTNQRMVEHILGLAGEPDLIDELGRHQVVNDRFDAQHGQQVQAEPRADHRRRAQRAFRLRVEADRCARRWSPATWQAHSPQQPLPSTCMRRAPRAAHHARPVRARSPRRKTDYRRPSRRSSGPARQPRGPARAAPRPVLRSPNHSAAQGLSSEHRAPASARPRYSGR